MSDKFTPLNIAVLTVSDTRTEETDTSGKSLVDNLTTAGHSLAQKLILTDNVYSIRARIAQWIADENVQAVVSTGGTGVTGRDGTPEAETINQAAYIYTARNFAVGFGFLIASYLRSAPMLFILIFVRLFTDIVDLPTFLTFGRSLNTGRLIGIFVFLAFRKKRSQSLDRME